MCPFSPIIRPRCARGDLKCVDAAAPQIDKGRHTLDVALPAEPVLIDGDRTRITQIVPNLLNNAAKYTPTQGAIRLEARPDAGQLHVAVRDNGIGIDTTDLDKVFQIFSQLPEGAAQAQGGLGIGLALVRGLLSLHGGRITAHSEGRGLGSEFVATLPLVPA